MGQTKNTKLFGLGQIVMTATVNAQSDEFKKRAAACLTRHANCDWGDLDPYDAGLNDQALDNGGRILSSYDIDPQLWIITEAADDLGFRAVTTLLLPSDY